MAAEVDWRRHALALRAALRAKEALLVAARLGKGPSESLWSRLAHAREATERFDAEVAALGEADEGQP